MGTFRCKKSVSRAAALNLLALACCLLVSSGLAAAENEQQVPSTITNVTVFLNQAQVTRQAKVSLPAGISSLVFDRISPYINLNSIQVKSDNNIMLLSVSQRNNFLVNEEKPRFIVELEDTLNAVKNQVALLNIRKESLQLEKDVILANKQIGGASSGVKIEDLEDALILFRKRSQEIGEELLKLNAQEAKLQAIRRKLQAQLDEYLNNGNSALEVVVTVKTLSAVNNARIEWSYLVGNASWQPFYDVRVKDTKSPLQLVSKANIRQATGEDWKNVILKLSTANPNESGTKPELQTKYVGLRRQFAGVYGWAGAVERDEATPRGNVYKKERLSGSDTVAVSLDPVAVADQSMANIEFAVTSACTVPSDNNPHQVDLTVSNLNASYAYAAVPKLDMNAFVTARVAGNDLVNQVSGEANVYFDGTFVGKTYISGTTSDSMLISLGRDKRIQIQRTLLKDFSSSTFSGSSRKELSTWEISVRNTRKEPLLLVIEDQIPVSTDKEVEVKLLSSGNATYDETSGRLTWSILLEPEQSQTLRFSFEIKYPKGRQVSSY